MRARERFAEGARAKENSKILIKTDGRSINPDLTNVKIMAIDSWIKDLS
jgi:hypothetical protein